ncbi:hypothetical protein Tco_0711832 [Tanacetum coccineum]
MLKERIKSLSGNMNEDKVKKDIEEIETINIELDHRVSKLIAENEHLKQTYKQLYDSIKPTRIRLKEQCDANCSIFNAKSVENSDLNAQTSRKVHKVDLEPLSSKLKNNREAHVDYIRITKENVDTLVLRVFSNNVDDPFPSSPLKSEKLVAVTPMNKARKVTFAKTSTTSDNNTQIQVEFHQSQTTSKPFRASKNEKMILKDGSEAVEVEEEVKEESEESNEETKDETERNMRMTQNTSTPSPRKKI